LTLKNIGNSISGWSEEILVSNFSDSPAFQIVEGVKTIFLIFTLKSNPQSPTAVNLAWGTYSANELLNLVKNLFEKSLDIGYTRERMLLFSNTQIDNVTIVIDELDTEHKTNLTSIFLLSNSSDSIKINNTLIMNLNSDTNYSFKLNIFLSSDVSNQTVKTKNTFRFTSEPTYTSTFSAYDAFKSSLEIVYYEKNQITVQFVVSDLISNNYNLIEIFLNERIDELNETQMLDKKLLKKPSTYINIYKLISISNNKLFRN